MNADVGRHMLESRVPELIRAFLQLLRTVLSIRKSNDGSHAEKRRSDEARSGTVQRLVVSISEMNAELAPIESIAAKLQLEYRVLFSVSGRSGSGLKAHHIQAIADKLTRAQELVRSVGGLPTEYSAYFDATISDLDRTHANVGAALARLHSLRRELELEYKTVNKQRLQAIK